MKSISINNKDTDYDTKGNLTPNASDGRAKAWTERAQRAGATATDRGNRKRAVEDGTANRQKLANALQRRDEEQERTARLDELERAAAKPRTPEPAFEGGVDPPVWRQCNMTTNTNPLEILTEGERLGSLDG